jgi:hypothetical protein
MAAQKLKALKQKYGSSLVVGEEQGALILNLPGPTRIQP